MRSGYVEEDHRLLSGKMSDHVGIAGKYYGFVCGIYIQRQ